MANLIISRVSNGKQVKDKLLVGTGLNHGKISLGNNTLEETLYIRHDDLLNPVTNLKVYISGLSELIEWGNDNFGLEIDKDNNGIYDNIFKSGLGDSLSNAINLGSINVGQEKVIRLRINAPNDEDTIGIRNFNINFNYDFV